MDKLILMSSMFGSIATITAIFIKTYKTISTIEKKINDWEESLNKNTLYIMKLALYCTDLDTVDRINAGQNYLKIQHDYLIEKKLIH